MNDSKVVDLFLSTDKAAPKGWKENLYPVNDIYGTIQGEGSNTGLPMVVVRLQGCSVGCPFCDTKETWTLDPDNEEPYLEKAIKVKKRWAWSDAKEIASKIADKYPKISWIMLTGGEPAQYDLTHLIWWLQAYGYKVALETSGTELKGLTGDIRADWVCVSPKIGMPGGREFLMQSLLYADELKFVIGRETDLKKLEALLHSPGLQINPSLQIALQPMSQSGRATEMCFKTCLEKGWRLSIQVHKYIGVS